MVLPAPVAAAHAAPIDEGDGSGNKRGEIYTWNAPWQTYAMNWSVRTSNKFRLAVGSFLESYHNTVQLIELDDERGVFREESKYAFAHAYPPTKLAFIPDKAGDKPDLLATAGDLLRLWRIDEDGVTIESILDNTSATGSATARKSSEFCSPLTSFDWNDNDLKRLGTSSIDTTCTIWDVERGVVDTQLIAHDKAVYDIAWGGTGVFASVSADSSVRVFDLRDKEHSTIIFESNNEKGLLRLGWNKQDPRYIATMPMESSAVIVLDIRFPTVPIAVLSRHQDTVNALNWAPHSSRHICTAGDDTQALIWDLTNQSMPQDTNLDPILSYSAGQEINQLQWSTSMPDWVAVCFGSSAQILRV